jgi:hypothetical protein
MWYRGRESRRWDLKKISEGAMCALIKGMGEIDRASGLTSAYTLIMLARGKRQTHRDVPPCSSVGEKSVSTLRRRSPERVVERGDEMDSDDDQENGLRYGLWVTVVGREIAADLRKTI